MTTVTSSTSERLNLYQNLGRPADKDTHMRATAGKITIEALQEAHRYQAEIGRKYSHEFVFELADQAGEAVNEWLKSQGAPEVITSLLDNWLMLNLNAVALHGGAISDVDAAGLVELIPETMGLVSKARKLS